jgi:hypothetical protein
MKYKLVNNNTKEETLCDKVTIEGFDYYVSDEKIHFGYVWNTILEQIETMFKEKTFHDDLKGVIATNNPNTAIPKVVDEVEKFALEYENSFSCGAVGTESTDFIEGYNKSQATHPFSEEDMIEFLNWIRDNTVFDSAPKPYHIKTQTRLSQEELLQLWKEQKPKIVYYE